MEAAESRSELNIHNASSPIAIPAECKPQVTGFLTLTRGLRKATPKSPSAKQKLKIVQQEKTYFFN